jgi:hypothetical protein
MFFHFSQNNSGGSFVYDYKRGLTHHVVIEADSASQANHQAELIGIYFDGCAKDRDCDCCGDRWYAQYSDNEGYDVPTAYGQPLGTKYVSSWGNMAWMEPGRETVVHFADGTRKWYNSDNTLADEQ